MNGKGPRARGGDRRPYLHEVAAQVVPEDLVGHHAALGPHRQAPLAAGPWLGPQQEGPEHVSPQQGEGAGPGKAEGEAEGRPLVWTQPQVAPGHCPMAWGAGPDREEGLARNRLGFPSERFL